MKDFDIKESFDIIKKTSKAKFKKIIKIKAREYDMRYFTERKINLSKIRDTKHKHLKLSNYLELKDINAEEAKAIFQFRSRMAQFNGNYKGKNPIKACPLCFSHPDTQEWSFKCPEINRNITILGNYDDIFDGIIDKKLAKTVLSIIKFRQMSLIGAQ